MLHMPWNRLDRQPVHPLARPVTDPHHDGRLPVYPLAYCTKIASNLPTAPSLFSGKKVKSVAFKLSVKAGTYDVWVLHSRL